LEAAERAAGIGIEAPAAPAQPDGSTESVSDPKDLWISEMEKVRRDLAEMHARIQTAFHAGSFSIKELRTRMENAGRPWPPEGDDENRTPADLWVRYAPGK
jgi:hypothetical protein